MTAAIDPKHSLDEWGVLGEPRFIPQLPPRSAGGSGRLDAVRPLMDALRARPNVWAAIAETEKRHGVDGIKSGIARGRFGPKAAWESAIRFDAATKRHVLYARFVGGQARRP